jgi:hypothetical protein
MVVVSHRLLANLPLEKQANDTERNNIICLNLKMEVLTIVVM